jgi:hypothetical protein
MKRLSKAIFLKFQEWAINNISAIFWQWFGFSLVELANAIGWFDKAFEDVKFVNSVLDWLWYIDTAYFTGSILFRLIYYNRPRRFK